jgi:predicted nucleic acid-binding protein
LAFPPLEPHIVVVDTDVASFLFKRDSRADRYAPHLVERILVLSAQSRAELYAWPHDRNWGVARRQELEQFILARFSVEYPDDRLCRLYGELVAAARQQGLPLPASDAWQAATALSLGVPLVTHNVRNYRGVAALQVITEAHP